MPLVKMGRLQAGLKKDKINLENFASRPQMQTLDSFSENDSYNKKAI